MANVSAPGIPIRKKYKTKIKINSQSNNMILNSIDVVQNHLKPTEEIYKGISWLNMINIKNVFIKNIVSQTGKDYKTVKSEGYEFKVVIDRTKRIIFKEDEAILKGGCIVETEVGTIDAQLETQVEAIKKALEL